MADWEIDASGIEELVYMIDEYGETARKTINDVLHGEGEKIIEQKINALLPSSGRRFKGHRSGAKGSNPFRHTDGNLYVYVRSVPSRHYLYFPDDGSNTISHAGQQHFMLRGAEDSKEEIIETCVGKLAEMFK